MTGTERDAAAWLRSFRPRSMQHRGLDYLRGGIGALIGVTVAAVAGRLLDVGPQALPFIVAPIGASAVLLFAAPASPLAQPWPVFGGNLVSTLIGVLAGRLIHDTALAAAVAVGAAIATMMALRCLHPPGGACALFAAVGASVVHDQGFAFAVFPVAINSVFLLVIAIAVNNLTGRRYPHVAEVPAAGKLGLRTADIEEAIARLDQGLDILPADVVALMRNAEAHALDRQLGRLEVSSLMTADVVTVQPFESVYRVRLIMTQNRVKAVPVIDPQRRVLGIVTIYDLFFLGMASVAAAETVMTAPVTTIRADAPLSRLVAVMTEQELRHLPVVDGEDKLVGIVSRTELITVLNRALLNAGGLGTATAD